VVFPCGVTACCPHGLLALFRGRADAISGRVYGVKSLGLVPKFRPRILERLNLVVLVASRVSASLLLIVFVWFSCVSVQVYPPGFAPWAPSIS
jgi:hypothetical protein